MSSPGTNLLNLERVSKAYGVRPLLTDVSLGVAAGERIGVVGRNGDGKTTLLNVMTGAAEPDSGRVSRQRGLLVGYLRQTDELVDTHTVREAVLAGRSDHEWAADAGTREVVEVLLAGVTLDRAVAGLSGGERRRCSLAALLLGEHDLVILDEPTNHLDVEAVAWLAGHLARRSVGARRRDPRPVVPRRGLRVDLGGPRRLGRRLRGRLLVVRPRPGRAPAAERGHRAAPPQPGPQGARLAASRPAGPDLQAEVPHRRRQRADRRRARAARPAGAAAVRDPAARQGRHRRRGRRPEARRADAAVARDLAARAGRPGRPRRRQRRRQDLGARPAVGRAGSDGRQGAAGPHRRAPAPHPAHRRARPGGAGAGRPWSRCAG